MVASDSRQNSHASFLSLGTNLGDRKSNLTRALLALGGDAEISMGKISSIYQTEPQNFTEQASFFNCVCEIETSLSPIQLLRFCKSVEISLGRVVTFKYGPRIIDIDILLYDDLKLATSELSIPHPELVHRNFALVPLHEIAPDLVVNGNKLEYWLNSCRAQSVTFAGKIEIF
jgi:2-amino-4-hydroxy-6-hydroxymethyldihydropteridine diphosphokinase